METTSNILDPETVTGCEYLYNLHPYVLKTMLYPEAVTLKLTSAKILISTLYEEENTIRSNGKIYRDEERIAKVHNAIKFNTRLLEELK